MKNIHVLKTDKPSKLYFNHNKEFEKYQFSKEPFINGLTNTTNQHIYITSSDEEIKEGDYYLPFSKSIVKKTTKYGGIEKSKTSMDFSLDYLKKIILTTDQDLIKDGVQAIDDEFLEWFVKNPSCEFVKTQYHYETICDEGDYTINPAYWTIIIPKEELYERTIQSISLNEVDKEEPEQETLEEVAERLYPNYQQEIFIKGAKWQQERMYSEEEVGELLYNIIGQYGKHYGIMIDGKVLNDLFEQFKKK